MSVREGKKISNAIKLRKIGLITAGVSLSAIVVILLVALLKSGTSSGFTVKIDNPVGKNTIHMSDTNNGKNTTVLSADPIKAMWQTTAEDVETYLANFTTNDIGGSQNMPDTNPKRQGYTLAQVYTVFLTNTSTDEAQDLTYEVHLDGYVAPENGSKGVVDYLRILCQTSIVNGESLSNELKNTYYGLESGSAYGTMAGEDDRRECISTFTQEQNEVGRTVRKPSFTSVGNEGYCNNLNIVEGSDVVVQETITLNPEQKMRFTFVSYLEGNDLESNTPTPYTAQLMMSLHFGTI